MSTIPTEGSEHCNECLLHDLFGIRVIAQTRICKTIDAPEVAIVQKLKVNFGTLTQSLDQLLIVLFLSNFFCLRIRISCVSLPGQRVLLRSCPSQRGICRRSLTSYVASSTNMWRKIRRCRDHLGRCPLGRPRGLDPRREVERRSRPQALACGLPDQSVGSVGGSSEDWTDDRDG